MRLDLFLPFVKKSKAGKLRQWLSRLGPTWLSSPVRRVIQGICFVAFLVLFFYVCWPYSARPSANAESWPSHYADDLGRKEKIAAEFFLVIDPLVSLSTALASRARVWSLTSAGIILLVCVFIPRGFLAAGAGLASGVLGGLGLAIAGKVSGANLDDPQAWRPVRPPGSVPEEQFLQMCIRCGECFKACPNDVLQPLRFQQGLDGLWTPYVVADWAGCESSCNACGQVCPTNASVAVCVRLVVTASMSPTKD